MSSVAHIPDLAPDALHCVEENVRRSRFITRLGHAASPEVARALVERVRAAAPDATHHCFAFAAGPAGNTALIGYSDDGEPHGTAGRPMLTVLLHSGVGEIVAVITRYFGGVKLGTGGLVRAYQQGVRNALDTLPVKEHLILTRVRVCLQYTHVTPFLRLAPTFQGAIAHENFDASATYDVALPTDNLDAFARAVNDLTGGTASVTPLTPQSLL